MSDGVRGTSGGATGAAADESPYSLAAADEDDIYKVPQSNNPVDPSKIPEGVLFQVNCEPLFLA